VGGTGSHVDRGISAQGQATHDRVPHGRVEQEAEPSHRLRLLLAAAARTRPARLQAVGLRGQPGGQI